MPVERFWVEVNSRANYPIKHALKQMEEEDIIDMECDGTKFCVSEITQEVALYGLQMTVQAWNTHVIHGSFFNYVSYPWINIHILCNFICSLAQREKSGV